MKPTFMSASTILDGVKRLFVRIGVGLMPYIPLPWERYRKALMNDSEKRYGSGRWDYLNDVSEAHRYSIINGCCEYFKSPDRRVLDVGCGEGILQRRVAYSTYVGVDVNAEAIRRAKDREDEQTKFMLTDAGKGFPSEQMFDVIVFNESLYYMQHPADVFALYRKSLAQDGIMIVCMFQTYLARKLWQQLRALGMAELTAVKISNEVGFSSMVKVYANEPLPARRE